MKKVLLVALVMVFAGSVCFSQTTEEIKASQARVKKISKLQKMPRYSEMVAIDGAMIMAHAIVVESMAISEVLEEAEKNKLPSVGQCEEVSDRIKTQTANIKLATLAIPNLVKTLKLERNPLVLLRAKSCIKYIKNSTSSTAAESVYQAKTVGTLAKKIKK